MFDCRPRAMPSAPAGTSSVIDDPAATYAPSPTAPARQLAVAADERAVLDDRRVLRTPS
jgi:hypothetical protein